MVQVIGGEGGGEMLQRAASNAYSSWWASNIRTKQSKWLDTNLQELEDKMKAMIKHLEVDADSFAKKAEMYYQKRPELINFVEEMYKAYKALADRFDRVSGELHKANHTLASAFPDQFQLIMPDDEEDGLPRGLTAIDSSRFRKVLPEANKSRDACSALKNHHRSVSTHIIKENAQKEIERIQKEILSLQTEKEFVKNSYECGLAKFWEIENRINDLQDQVCNLQDEKSVSSIIDDDEARGLMAAAAIKSCEKSLVSLQQKHNKSGEEVEVESKRIIEAKNRLMILKGQTENFNYETVEEQLFQPTNDDLVQVKQDFQMNSGASAVDLTEKIDELVEKVTGLEVTVLSQMAQIQTLRSETDGLQKHLRELEEDKANLITGSNSSHERLRQAEDELNRVQDIEKDVHHKKGIFQTHFREACNSLNDISEKLQSPKHEEKVGISASNIENLEKNEELKAEGNDNEKGTAAARENEVHANLVESDSDKDLTQLKEEHLMAKVSSLLKDVELDDRDDNSDWHGLFDDGLESRQKIILLQHISILQNYKEAKKRLTEMEKKNQEYHFEMMSQIHDLKSENAIKEWEIQDLRSKLSSHKQDQVLNIEEDGSSFQVVTDVPNSLGTEEEVKLCHLQQQYSSSPTEKKFRTELDALLDGNLDFWLRFSTSYHHIQKFEATFKELQAGLDKLKDSNDSSKQDTTPLDRKMRELHTELQVWLEQNGLLKGELQCRFMSLCNFQEEISKASMDSEGEDHKLTPYQAAKFQGELLNMQQENNKIAKELQTGLDHVKGLRSQVAKALSKLRESFDLSVPNEYHLQYQNFRHCSTKSKIPLRTFLFGAKRKKPSMFSCIGPALHSHRNKVKAGFPS